MAPSKPGNACSRRRRHGASLTPPSGLQAFGRTGPRRRARARPRLLVPAPRSSVRRARPVPAPSPTEEAGRPRSTGARTRAPSAAGPALEAARARRRHGYVRAATPRLEAPRTRPLAVWASQLPGRTGRAERGRAAPGTRQAAAACTRTRPRDHRARRTGTCSSFRRPGTVPGRSRDRPRGRRQRPRPRAAGAATRGQCERTPEARRGAARLGAPAKSRPVAGSSRPRSRLAPKRRDVARETEGRRGARAPTAGDPQPSGSA